MNNIEKIINDAWENKNQVSQNSDKSIIDSINQIIDDLDQGKVRVAKKINALGCGLAYLLSKKPCY